MCIAILKKKKGIITNEELSQCFKRNPDGAGIAYTKDNVLYIEKGIFKEKDFINKVREIESICDNNMLIHCRIGTSGKKDVKNTHPFLVSENIALIHNGILDVDIPKKSKMNDTFHFIEKFLKGIPEDELMHNEYIARLISHNIGARNKFVLLNNKGEFRIINSEQGHWKKNVWFSNNSYEKPKYTIGWCNNMKSFYGTQTNYGTQTKLWNNNTFMNGTFYNDKEKITPVKKALSFDDEYYLYDYIYNLKKEDFIKLDEYPVYDHINKILIPVEKAEYTDFEFLEDISEDLYEYYLEQYELSTEEVQESEIVYE